MTLFQTRNPLLYGMRPTVWAGLTAMKSMGQRTAQSAIHSAIRLGQQNRQVCLREHWQVDTGVSSGDA